MDLGCPDSSCSGCQTDRCYWTAGRCAVEQVAVEHTQLGCLTGVGGLQPALDFELDAALAECRKLAGLAGTEDG